MGEHSSQPTQQFEQAMEQALKETNGLQGSLLPLLHAVQDRLGYIPIEAVARVAQALNISRAEVHGVITFYHDFRTSPPGRHLVRLCQAEACQSMGSTALSEHAKARLGVEFHQTTADGAVTLEPVYCLGGCACSPTMMVDGRLYGRVSSERFDQVVGMLGEKA